MIFQNQFDHRRIVNNCNLQKNEEEINYIMNMKQLDVDVSPAAFFKRFFDEDLRPCPLVIRFT